METIVQGKQFQKIQGLPTRWGNYLNGNRHNWINKLIAYLELPTRWGNYLNGNQYHKTHELCHDVSPPPLLGKLLNWKPYG